MKINNFKIKKCLKRSKYKRAYHKQMRKKHRIKMRALKKGYKRFARLNASLVKKF